VFEDKFPEYKAGGYDVTAIEYLWRE